MVKVIFIENDQTLQVPHYNETISDLLNTGCTAIYPNFYEYEKLSLNLNEVKIFLQKQ
ncbi:hypothetical protein ACQKCU_05220 [Heyndrickxia sporothermodurans]